MLIKSLLFWAIRQIKLSITEETQGIRDVIIRNEKSVKRIPIDSNEISLDLNTPNEYNIAYRQEWKKLN